MTEPQIQYARASDGVNIAYAVLGEGPPFVYSSNAFGDIHWYIHDELTRTQVDAIVASGRRVVMYDTRGCGSSDRDVADFSLEARLQDLEAVVEQLALERFALFGRIQGGPAAMLYSVRHPERVSHLILVNTFASGAAFYEKIPAMQLVDQLSEMAQGEWEFFTLALASAITGFEDVQLAQKRAGLMRSSTSPATWRSFVEQARKIDLVNSLSSISAPTLVVMDTSWFGHADVYRPLAAMIPGAHLVTAEGYSREVIAFLNGDSRPAASTRSSSGEPLTSEASSSSPQATKEDDASAFRTILFTDLVDHTLMMQRLGDHAGRAVLREHERITRDLLQQHGGIEVKTDGDSFMASFTSATNAVECAVALQRAFASHNASAREPIKIRAGLNVGEPLAERGDYFGSAVILAARIKDEAGAEEILVPEAMRHLLSGKRFVYVDRGETMLKGFEDAVRLYEVRWRA